MYAYLCNISMVRNVGTRLYNLTKTQFMSETFHFSLHSFVRYSLFLVEGQLWTFSWVLSLLGRYFYNMHTVKMFEIVFSFNDKDNNMFPWLQIFDFPITYRNASECACLHKTVNMVVFLLKVMKIPTQKGEQNVQSFHYNKKKELDGYLPYILYKPLLHNSPLLLYLHHIHNKADPHLINIQSCALSSSKSNKKTSVQNIICSRTNV